MNDYSRHAALDLFAGTGIGVALRDMGVSEYAVDIMPEVAQTRELNGMTLSYTDAWDIERAHACDFDTLIGGPPCPTFSTAGKGSGRAQMPLILQAIDDEIWTSITELKEWADKLEDERTGLVLIPLAYVWRFAPDYIFLEQVPPALPIWGAYAGVLEKLGYSAKAQVLNAEQYGVPQTRKRAILLARKARLGEVQMPTPTHSRYYSHKPEKLDPGVKKWVSMAEALGANGVTTYRPTDRPTDRPLPHNRPSPTVTGGGAMTGGWEPYGTQGRAAIRKALGVSVATTVPAATPASEATE